MVKTRIRSQFILCMLIFGIVLTVVSAYVGLTEQQIGQITIDAQTVRGIQTKAGNLAYISNDYLQNRKNTQLTSWNNELSDASSALSKLNQANPAENALITNIKGDLLRLEATFNSVVLYVESIPENETGIVHPLLKTYANQFAVQNQALSFDITVLSSNLEIQVTQARQTSNALVLSLVGLFGAFFVAVYLLVFKRTFASLTRLQKEIKVIGSGNLDHVIVADSDDEVGDLSRNVNQMTADLKTVTASKMELETEIAERKKAEKEIESLSKFPLENPSSVLRVDQKGVILFANPSANEHLKGWQIKVGECIPERVQQIVTDAMASGQKSEFEENLGEEIFSFLVVPIVSEGYTNLYGRRITKRKKAEEALKQSQELIAKQLEEITYYYDNAPVGLAILDTNLRYVRVNKWLAKINGIPAEGHVGKPIREIVPALAEQMEELQRRIISSGEAIRDIEFAGSSASRPDERRTLISSWIPIKDSLGEVTEVYVIAEDITERKKAEEELNLYRMHLEKLVEERTKQLKDAERLATIGATAGMVGHDIRNPLQAITSDVYLAKLDLVAMPEGEDKQSLRESLTGIEKNVEYINKIVQDLQDYARPLSPVPKEIELERVFDDVLVKKGIPEGIKVTRNVEAGAEMVVCDSDLLKRILANLMNNAVQAMPNGGILSVRARREKKDLVITVEDTGVGISEDVKSRLFTPLFTTKSKGQGFGLVVVKRMTEALGGTIAFESEVGKGTKFIVRLPFQKG